MMQTMRPGLDSYVHFTPLHPHTTMFPLLDGLLASKMDKYDRYPLGPLEKRISGADVIVYESNSALFLTWKCWRLAPRARHIYRVSDDIRTLRSTPPRMVALEKELAPKFSLISVPCVWLAQKFLELPNVRNYLTAWIKKYLMPARPTRMCPVQPTQSSVASAFMMHAQPTPWQSTVRA